MLSTQCNLGARLVHFWLIKLEIFQVFTLSNCMDALLRSLL
ncbi:hypothetical protein EV13_0932 [Prochlorococcus sp. MIT 0702]|nr:hypothetical protein EV12_0447 [Prochlorococcus sp. MIT 0701]KGG29714.1 hypothetical protein EV13_0932 [Prochlorococcus sp. MIT 0702]